MEAADRSRAPSGVPLREYYRIKAGNEAAEVGDRQYRQQQPQPQQSAIREQQLRRRSPIAKLLSRITPSKADRSQAVVASHLHPETVETSACSDDMTAPGASSGSGSASIPAFRPASPSPNALQYAPPFVDGATSPGKAQLQAVRALARQQQTAPKRQELQPQGTPGLSEVSSVGRAINAQIEDTLAGMFMVTPPEVTSGIGGAGGGSTGCAGGSARSTQRQQQQQRRHGRGGSLAPGAPAREPSSGVARYYEPSAGHGSSECTLWPPELGPGSASPLGVPPQAPPAPAPPLTAMGTSSALEPLSIKSPVFMSRRRRSMVCELDEPGSVIAYPKARSRTSAGRRLLAAFLPCLVPPPSVRSPAPSLRGPGGRHTPSSQGTSPLPGPAPAFGMDPLRQSMVELTLGDPELRPRASTRLADEARAFAGGGQAGSRLVGAAPPGGAMPRQSPLYGDLLGLQREEDEEAQANMASPVLPSRPGSGCGTPAGLALGDGAEDDSEGGYSEGDDGLPAAVLAKRNLMDVLRSKEAGAAQQQLAAHHRQHVLQHPPHFGQQPPQQQQGVQRSSGSRPIAAHRLQPWQQQRGAAAPPAAAAETKATHVSLAQLLAEPSVGGQPHASRGWRQAGGGTGRQPSTGSKRGREALGVSRPPSGATEWDAALDDAPAFTPKRPLLRDLSKPSYRSEDLHRVLSPLLANPGGRGGLGRPASRGSKDGSRAAHAALPMRAPAREAGHPGCSPAAGSRPASAQALRRSVSAPASPLPAPAAGAAHGAGGSMPSSPLLGARMTKAAAARAAASQRKLQEREAQLQAVMAKSPDRWLRAAAAQGLSLRDAAVFASPGKSARPHYHPSPPAVADDRQQAGQQPPWQQRIDTAAAVAAAMATPGGNIFDCFAAGEAGVEPYSARLHTAERSGPGASAAAAAALASAAAPVAVPPAVHHAASSVGPLSSGAGSKLDFDLAAAAGSSEYMEMLLRLEQGLRVNLQQLEPFTHPAPPPLPEDCLAASDARAGAARHDQLANGAVTVRARQLLEIVLAQEAAVVGSRRASSKAAEYSLQADLAGGHEEVAESPEPRGALLRPVPLAAQHPPAAPTPHHNALYGRALTPTKSSPLAQQRMVSMEAALRAGRAQHAQQEQRQRRHKHKQPPQQLGRPVGAGQAPARHVQQPVALRGPHPGGSNGGGSSRQASSAGRAASTATASASISFGSAGCAASTGGNAGAASCSGAAAGSREAGPERLSRLEALLLQAEAAGEHFTLAQLHTAGFSSHDVQALKQSLGWHG